MLQLNHIKKVYGDTVVLADIDYIFEEGKIYPLLAGNGAGKTTLLKCMCGECIPDSGTIRTRTNHVIYYASKEGNLPEYITGENYIKYLCGLKKGTKNPDVYINKVGLSDEVKRRLVKDYSFEDKKRLELAAFLVQKPNIILFDAVLDDCSDAFVEDFLDIIKNECNRRIVVVTTGRLDIARFLADDILMLNRGKLKSITSDMIDAPEVMRAIADILGEDANDGY